MIVNIVNFLPKQHVTLIVITVMLLQFVISIIKIILRITTFYINITFCVPKTHDTLSAITVSVKDLSLLCIIGSAKQNHVREREGVNGFVTQARLVSALMF